MDYPDHYEVIVVGGGHAGTEAALAAARCGARTLLLTHDLDRLGQMSCNPAIGGIGKGHLVREIDALGGLMGLAADRAGIHFRTLNASKGAAVRATRAQADRALYRREVRLALEAQTGLDLFAEAVDDLWFEADRLAGVVTASGLRFRARQVVLTTGTFLAGRIHIGLESRDGGRIGDPPALALAQQLRERLPGRGRLKTGTPPRLDRRTIDFARLEPQPGDSPLPRFSALSEASDSPRQVDCHITWTNPRSHEIIRAALDRSPLYAGVIEGIGPRYCPSIEDKVVRFAERERHQIFVEPEGLESGEIYPNGISTSLPFDAQLALVRSIEGFEQARIVRPGYAIEYDFFDPRELDGGLASRAVEGLFLAGQVNGTTGYEEAAAQGLVAGLNAARAARGLPAWRPTRDQSYIGVLIDDLVTRGVTEPYRMFTSRAEYRLRLREDNADLRLTPLGRDLGLVDDRRWARFEQRHEAIERERQRLRTVRVAPGSAAAEALEARLGAPLGAETTLGALLRRPQLSHADLAALPGLPPTEVAAEIAAQVETELRYAGYIERQQAEIERVRRHESLALPADLDYAGVAGLTHEVRERLTRQRPATLGQAGRLPGITPAAISLLLIHLKKRGLTPVPQDAVQSAAHGGGAARE